jgi:transposase InsO family protein
LLQFLFAQVDFTRRIRGWHLGRSLDQTLTLIALDRALAGHRPEIHHSDQSIQYAAAAYIQMLRAAGAKVSMAEIGEARQNGCAERLIRTVKEEEVDLSEYECHTDAVSPQTGMRKERSSDRSRGVGEN